MSNNEISLVNFCIIIYLLHYSTANNENNNYKETSKGPKMVKYNLLFFSFEFEIKYYMDS